jgi:hypothetical protein
MDISTETMTTTLITASYSFLRTRVVIVGAYENKLTQGERSHLDPEYILGDGVFPLPKGTR